MSQSQSPIRNRKRLAGSIVFWFSLAFVSWLACVYAIRFEGAAVTIIPVWAWLGPGLVLAVLTAWLRGRKFGGAVFFFFCVFTLALADEPRSLLRWSPPTDEKNLRVLSYNWGGAAGASGDLLALDPDIILLQESPKEPIVRALAERLGGHYLFKHEASIVSRWHLTEIPTPVTQGVFSTRAVVEAPPHTIQVVSLRLSPPLFRFDFWAPTCWQAYKTKRQIRADQLQTLLSGLEGPRLVGGDFNSPAGDRVFDALAPTFRDAFQVAGTGFGNTAPAFLPLHRIDQVWATQELRPLHARTLAAPSDHKILVVDFELRDKQE